MRTAHRPNPDDFISLLSSEDEAPLTRKRKYSAAEQASAGRNRDSQGRAKRVRTSQAPGDSITGANGLKAGKHEVVEGSDIAIPGFGSHGEKKKAGGFSPDSVFLPKSPPMFTLQSISLQLPVFSPQREGTWLTRFTEWAQLLCSANRDSPSAAEITPALIRTAYKQYIDIHSRLKSNKKRAARLVAQQFKDSSLLDLIRAFRPLQNEAAQLTAAAQETLEEGLDATLAGSEIRLDSLRPLALPPQSQILSSAAAPPSLLTEQSGALYILDVAPQLPQDATMCETILASQQGSQPASQLDLLPEPQPKHLRQTQHASVKVTMSLPSAVPSGAEALRQQRLYFPSARDPFNMCLLCGAEGHVADKCTRSPNAENVIGLATRMKPVGILRNTTGSFRPGPGTIKRVNALPVSCAKCGSKKHFHGDCRPNGMPALRCDHRFHLDNMRQYLDPASSAGPIIGTDACRVAPKAGGFRVYGQVLASPVDNVHYYSGSDDSDEGLCVVTSTPVRHIAPRHLHRILRHLVEAEEEDVVEVAIMVAQVANRDKVVRLLRMFRDVMRDKCKVANMCRVDKASRLAEMAGVAEMDKDIMKALIYTISRVFEKTKTAQANRMARESEAKGSDDVAEEVQMDTNEAKTDKLHKMFQLIRLIKQAKSTQVNKRARENELQDKDDVDRITKAKLNGA
ncbi:hypothetical protein MKX07_001710 [Trichoderma sp. CBMAI-0711]|nr:hypothetical protein MKX07_001710 [Trichoderma sp. CBMAI-0711]